MKERKNIAYALEYLGKTGLLAFGYYVTGRLGLMLAVPPGYATAIWPPSGVALAGLWILGYRFWPGIWLGSFAIALFTSFDVSHSSSLLTSGAVAALIAVGATLQAIIGVRLCRAIVPSSTALERVQDIAWLLVLGGPVACVVNASIGVATVCFLGRVTLEKSFFNWLTWWGGDTIGVLVFTPLLIVLFARNASVSRMRKTAVCIASLAAFMLTVCMFIVARNAECERERVAFEKQAASAAAHLEEHIIDYRDSVYSLALLFSASDYVTRDNFDVFAKGLLERHPGMTGLAWIEEVPGDSRRQYEETQRAQGLQKFKITERDASHALITASIRNVYYPVTYVEPNKVTLGFDVASEPVRKITLERARDSGMPQASPRLNIFQNSKASYGTLIFRPIYRKGSVPNTVEARRRNLQGFVVGGIIIPDMISASFSNIHELGFDIVITDGMASSMQRLLYDSRTADHKEPIEGVAAYPDELYWQRQINVAGRLWTIHCIQSQAMLIGHQNWTIWFVLSGGFVFTGLLGVFVLVVTARADIVQRLVEEKTKEQSELTANLRAAEELKQIILDSSHYSIIAVNTSGIIHTFNRTAAHMLGYSAEEMIGKSPHYFHDTEEIIVHAQKLSEELGYEIKPGFEVFSTRPRHDMPEEQEWTYIRKDGSRFPVLLSITALRDGHNAITGFMGIAKDISKEKENVRQREALVAELTESNTELERFAYVASHDMQEPLRMIANFAALVSAEYSDKLDAQGKQYVQILMDSALRMQDMVNDLLEYARIGKDTVPFTTVNTEHELNRALDNVYAAIAERCAIITHDPLPKIQGNPIQFVRLLQNLIGNGLKYQAQETPRIHVAAEDKGAFWQFSVTDNGIGMEEEYTTQIFEPFIRLHSWRQFKGTGIGLAVCKKIVENHGGKIWVTSQPGKGSAFFFTVHKASET